MCLAQHLYVEVPREGVEKLLGTSAWVRKAGVLPEWWNLTAVCCDVPVALNPQSLRSAFQGVKIDWELL